jgi:histidine--tRNA ligase
MNVKGTFDYMPEDMAIRNRITDVLRKNFEKYGYLPIETPMLNYYDLLSYKYGEDAEILSEIYHLTDQGERDLGLRYDLTVPFCKVVGLSKGLTMPFRRYEIGRVFRNGPVKAGRTREFYQCDVDVVGIDNRYIEAEQILMAINTYRELGIEIYVRYNNRKLMSGIILASGVDSDNIDKVIGVIDKLEKVSKEELYDMLREIGLKDEVIDKLFELFSMDYSQYESINFADDIKEAKKLFDEGLSEIKELNEYLLELGIIDDCKFTPTLARGLSIYTGVVFEFYDKLKRINCAIGAGGRYDKIITNFMNNGEEYPAVGLSFGLEPIFVILKENEKKVRLIDIYMVPFGEEKERVETLKLASKFRSMGYRVLIEMKKKKIGKCFEYADREKIHYVMIIGSDEVNSQVFKIKDMDEKVEHTYNLLELEGYLSNNK